MNDQDAAAKEAAIVKQLLRIPLPSGMMRTVYKCKSCGQIQSHEFVPYGLGRSAERNPCLCSLVSNSWTANQAIKLASRKAR
jgi:hypothetical protein